MSQLDQLTEFVVEAMNSTLDISPQLKYSNGKILAGDSSEDLQQALSENLREARAAVTELQDIIRRAFSALDFASEPAVFRNYPGEWSPKSEFESECKYKDTDPIIVWKINIGTVEIDMPKLDLRQVLHSE